MNREATVADTLVASGCIWRYEHLLEQEILRCPADSVVGSAVVELCTKMDEVLKHRYGNGDEAAPIEDREISKILKAVEATCNVWYFG